jgi:hypothetical protein
MQPEAYRRQFVDFVKLLYPEGVPEGVNCVSLSDSFRNVSVKIYFDPMDCIESNRVVVDTKKIAKDKFDKKINELFSEDDISWLKEIEDSFKDEIHHL